jgi:CspA family cold shock protein
VADDPIWREHWSGVESVVVKVAYDSIVLEVATEAPHAEDGNGSGSPQAITFSVERIPEPVAQEEPAALPEGTASDEPDRERGRVKWFDAEKGYGFLVRPTGEDLFVHHSEVEGDASVLGPGGEVEYTVGRNDRGPNARGVRLMG